MVYGVSSETTDSLIVGADTPGLTENGATVYFWKSGICGIGSPKSCRQLAVRVRQIVQETGCGKVNVIAHSKGGLDIRAQQLSGWYRRYDRFDCRNKYTAPGMEVCRLSLGKLPTGAAKIASAGDGTMKNWGDQAPRILWLLSET